MKTYSYLVGMALILATHCYSQELVARHIGSANPTNEGFSIIRSGTTSLSPVTGDQGFDAWRIGLNSQSQISQYHKSFTQQQLDNAANGWILSLTARIAPPFNQPSYGIFGEFSDGWLTYSLQLGASPNGDPIVRFGNTVYNHVGGGAGYHNYQLKYNPISSVSSLWIDGSEKLSGLTVMTYGGLQGLTWGSGQNQYSSLVSFWNEASFTIIPEPSSVALFGLASSIAAFVRRKQRTNVG